MQSVNHEVVTFELSRNFDLAFLNEENGVDKGVLSQDGGFFIEDLGLKAENEIEDDVVGHVGEVLDTLDGLHQELHSSVPVATHDMGLQALLVLGVVRDQALVLRCLHHGEGVVVHRGDRGRASAVVDNRHFTKVITFVKSSDYLLFAVVVPDLDFAVTLADVVEGDLDLFAVVIIIF